MNNHDAKEIMLSDGRILGYAEYGALSGKPIFYFHGNPGSRLDPLMLDQDVIAGCNARLISIDRPGIGGSSYQPRRRLADWPADVKAVADELGFEHFAVLGLSGGGPYVSACARFMPERLYAAGIASGMGPTDVPGILQGMGAGRYYLRGARIHPSFARMFIVMMKAGLESTRKGPNPGAPPGTPAADLAALAKPGVAEAYFAMLDESWCGGTRGVAWDATIIARPWGFRLEEINMPVFLWHGEADNMVPPAVARYVSGAIPNCTATFYPDEGHISMLANHLEEILQALLN
jgi:pimeloyl-ACP methyl ester carboxylesterase